MDLRVEQDGRVRRLTLAAPARRNVLDRALGSDLLRELQEAESDAETRVILLDADGPVFCGGMDWSALPPEDIFYFGVAARKPIVASIQGVAVSGGVALIANAHVVVAAQGSSFGLTDIREGRFQAAITAATARALGDRRTAELVLTGRVFSTPDALAWGLVHQVTPAFELEDRAWAIARGLADASPETIRVALDFFRDSKLARNSTSL